MRGGQISLSQTYAYIHIGSLLNAYFTHVNCHTEFFRCCRRRRQQRWLVSLHQPNRVKCTNIWLYFFFDSVLTVAANQRRMVFGNTRNSKMLHENILIEFDSLRIILQNEEWIEWKRTETSTKCDYHSLHAGCRPIDSNQFVYCFFALVLNNRLLENAKRFIVCGAMEHTAPVCHTILDTADTPEPNECRTTRARALIHIAHGLEQQYTAGWLANVIAVFFLCSLCHAMCIFRFYFRKRFGSERMEKRIQKNR